MTALDIGEVARRAGVSVSALRFYEEKGLIASVGRRGLRRQFGEDVLERLQLIAAGRAAGFTLAEIGRMFGADGRVSVDRQMLEEKAAELDEVIAQLDVLRTKLRHAAACPAPSHLECPTFRRMLRAASRGGGVSRSPFGEP
ncbi:helix-turn-helix domain-containing protein [Kitasatospora sp. NPDC097643]|uniref:helix-turn-helix domain-containing protein n=1 Tax=Kitasatospora sp. NPDC097643 TaxID=3157230 RepID=UPI003319F6BD